MYIKVSGFVYQHFYVLHQNQSNSSVSLRLYSLALFSFSVFNVFYGYQIVKQDIDIIEHPTRHYCLMHITHAHGLSLLCHQCR